MPLFETPVSAAVKSTIEGTFGLAGKVVEAAGNAVRGVGEAVGGALEGALSPAPVTVINGVGMAGQVGKSKVSGSGTIPASPKKSARPAVNPNMPTEKLLVVAVNYLSSIEKTLEQQLQFEKRAFQQQAQAEKEASIESGGSSFQNPFSNLGEKLDAIKDNAKERAGTVGKLLIGAGLLGTLGLAALGNLDTSQLEELKSNWAAFTDKISPIIGFVQNFAAALGTTAIAGAAVGSVFGWRGALLGLIGGKIYEDAYGTFNEKTGQREGGQGLLSSIVSNFPLAAVAIAPVTAIKFAYKGLKTIAGALTAFTKKQAARFMAWFAEKAFIRFAFSAYGKNRLWNLFLRYLEKKAQQRLLAQIAAVGAATAATTAAEATLAATGIGAPVAAVSAIVTKLIAAGFTAWLLWDLYQIWVEFSETAEARAQEATDDERANASPVSTAATPDATSTSGSANISGAPVASAAQTENLPSIPADVEKILATIRTRESGGNYGIPHPNGMPSQTASGAYAFTNDSWRGLTKKYNIGTEYSSAYLAPPPIQDAVAAKYVEEILQKAGGDVSKVPLAWYTGNIQGKMSAKALAINNGMTPQAYQAKWMADYTGGKYSASSYDSQGASSQQSAGVMGSLADLGKGAIESAGKVLQASLGEMSLTTGSQLSNKFNNNMQTPVKSESAAAAKISKISTELQNTVDLGKLDSTKAATEPASASISPIGKPGSSNDSKRDHFDPNYPSDSLLMEKYMQHQKLVIA
jgi:hypothetical protein